MISYQGVAITDGLNRQNHFLPFKTVINSYHDTWNTLIPMNLGHDRTKPIGFTRLSGVYMEPGKAYVTNKASVTESQEDTEHLCKLIKAYDQKLFCEEHKEELDELTDMLAEFVSDKCKVAPIGQAVAICDNDIVARVFPEIVEKIKDGLIDLRLLEPVYKVDENGEKGLLVPGVYKKERFLLFAHQYFRRNLSILNTTNEDFFNALEDMRNIASVDLKIALDMDLIGLAGTENLEVEYQYLWGPHFDEDLASIPEGVTCYKNEYYDNVFSNILQTQFYWHPQDSKNAFQCEELCDRENIFIDKEKTMLWGCRYVHSMINQNTGYPYHLDGAIRIYTDEQILERIDEKTDIKKYGKNADYKKLWRIDNDFPIPKWKELISTFYRDNHLIGEYLGGVDEKYEQIKLESSEHNKVLESPNEFIPFDLCKGDGIRIFFRYMDKVTIGTDRDVRIINRDEFIYQGGKKEKVLEADTVTLLKLLKRKGVNLRMPFTSMVEFGDTIFNFPTLFCKDSFIVDTVIESVFELCQAWDKAEDNRLISFGIALNLYDEAVQLSFAGHVADFVKLFEILPKLTGMVFEDWVESIYQANNLFKEARDLPNRFSLIHGDVVCFGRKIIPQNQIDKIWMEGKNKYARLCLSKEQAIYLKKHKIISAPFYKIKASKCSKCGKDYIRCGCIKFIDSDVAENCVEAESLGMTWTNRSTYFPDGQLDFPE